MQDGFIYYKTSSPAGDLISFMAGMKQIYHNTGKKAVVYQRLNMVGGGYEGSIHPYENEQKEPVCFSKYAFDMMRPLMLSQEYIQDFIVFTGQQHDFDLDILRQEGFTNQPRGSLNRYPNYVFPEMATDLSKKWIEIPTGISNPYQDKIIINFTQRYRNNFVNYHFLREHQDRILFVGLDKEKDIFCKEYDLCIPLMQVDNFYELARNISQCKFFIGNASMCFQICEATKTPRILECFTPFPNVIPIGEHAYDFYHQKALEYYFNKLLNK